jgi:glutaredoxin
MKPLLLSLALLLAAVNPTAAQCGRQSIFLFSASWCTACKEVEKLLTRHRIGYQRLEVTGKNQVQSFMRENFGTLAVPVVIVDGEFYVGYNAIWLRDRLCLE